MDDLLTNFDHDRIKVYRGHILVHTNGYSEHLIMLEKLFNELKNFNLKVAFEDTQLLKDELVFLGKFGFVLVSK